MIDYRDLLKTIEGRAPSFVYENLNYLVLMGSTAYGCATPESDIDVYGFCTPTLGATIGFPDKKFDQFDSDHVDTPCGDTDYNIYSVVKYFAMLVNNNPNIMDSLFVPDRCVLYANDFAKEMRYERHAFLSKRLVKNTLAYADSEFKVIQKKGRAEKRAALYDKYGYDTKTAYHCLRLLTQAEQALTYGDLSLDSNGSHYREIRNGVYSYDKFMEVVVDFRNKIEFYLETSGLNDEPDMTTIVDIFNRYVKFE